MPTYFVGLPGDSGMGYGNEGDIRYCINAVNADGGGTIKIAESNIQLTSTLEIQKNVNVSIDATNASANILGSGSASNPFRLFTIDPGATVSIFDNAGATDFYLHNGYDASGVGGGAILNQGNLTLTGVTIEGNTSTASGGAIYNASSGQLSLNGVTITTNMAQQSGGGIENDGGTVSINGNPLGGTHIADNTASQGNGGGISSTGGTITATDSALEIWGNSATLGGGLYVGGGTVTLDGGPNNSTFDYNNATSAGGAMYLANGSTTTLNNIAFGNIDPNPPYSHDTVGGSVYQGIYQQYGANLSETGVNDTDDPNGQPVQGP